MLAEMVATRELAAPLRLTGRQMEQFADDPFDSVEFDKFKHSHRLEDNNVGMGRNEGGEARLCSMKRSGRLCAVVQTMSGMGP